MGFIILYCKGTVFCGRRAHAHERKECLQKISEGKVSRIVMGIYCAAYVIYSAVCTAGDCFLVDIQSLFGKIDHYFQHSTIRIE
jgi:hypothetical protein